MAAFPVIGITEIVTYLPICSFCGQRATYDFLTRGAIRAFGCVTHYNEYRAYTFLGLGSATRLILAGSVEEDIKNDGHSDA